jgi:flagellar biogenesis protein FliO
MGNSSIFFTESNFAISINNNRLVSLVCFNINFFKGILALLKASRSEILFCESGSIALNILKQKKTLHKDFEKKQKYKKQNNSWLFKYLFSLIFVAFAMFGTFILMRKFKNKLVGINKDSTIQVLEKVSLDTRNHIALIKVKEKELLIGYGINGCTMLSEISNNFFEEDIEIEENLISEKIPKIVKES